MLERIKASLPSLAPAEQRVARLVLADPRAFASLPITELANRSHVSKPTVVRFCRSVGYDGLSDFKLKLAGSVSEGVPFIHRSVDVDDKTGDVMVKVIDNTVAAFLKYRNDASPMAIEKAVVVLLAAYNTGKRIEFFGAGNSGIVAQDAQHKFFRLGIQSIAYSDGHMQVMSASLLGPGDCVVVISNSGRTRDLMDACDIARKNGATTIVITATASPLAAAGHIHLAADHPEGRGIFARHGTTLTPAIARYLRASLRAKRGNPCPRCFLNSGLPRPAACGLAMTMWGKAK